MDNVKNYYEILGITEDEKKLSGDDFNKVCKKKYHSLALKLHPDRWANSSDEEKKKAEEKFKDVAEAYEVLSDPQKRDRYDNGGTDFDFVGFDPMDIFRRMSNMDDFGNSPFGSFFGGRNRVNKGRDIHTEVTITLEEAYNGVEKKVQIRKDKKCNNCNGTGSSDGKDHVCPACHGTGMETEIKQFGPGQMFSSSRPCRKCHGSGKDTSVSSCKYCGGHGIVPEYVYETINIPRGVDEGMAFTIEGKGNAPQTNGINGDLIVHIKIKNDNYFERPDNLNLVHYENVPFNECLVGFKKEFRCIDGSKVTVNAKELTKPGEAFIFYGKGMPDAMGSGRFGDYAIVINYELPKKLTNKQKEMLENFYK